MRSIAASIWLVGCMLSLEIGHYTHHITGGKGTTEEMDSGTAIAFFILWLLPAIWLKREPKPTTPDTE